MSHSDSPEPPTYVDLYAVQTDCALMGMAEHAGDRQLACFASGLASWEEFESACSMGVTPGFVDMDERTGGFTLSTAGRQRVDELRAAEVAAEDAGALTMREASAAHADIAHQHMVPMDAPVMRKLVALMGGDTTVRLTPEEASAAAAHLAIQTGPIRQKLILKLNDIAGDALRVEM